MKRLLTVLFAFALIFSLVMVTSASEPWQGEELRVYIEEKIVPILMGVATSIIALLGTLKCIFNALRALKESKLAFDKEQVLIKENSKRELDEIKAKYDEIKLLIKDVPELDMQIRELHNKSCVLIEEIANLSKITSLGFSNDSELVTNGNAREAILLANKNQELACHEKI